MVFVIHGESQDSRCSDAGCGLCGVGDLARDQIPEGLPGDVAERLGLLGGIDAVEADFDLAILAVEAGERVAVGDRDDLELLGKRGAGEGEKQDDDNEPRRRP
jgi:hypothetical protein